MVSARRVALGDIARVFLYVGAAGFGGGVGMLALIRQAVVERRRWLTDEQVGVGVAMGQMLPGPFVSNYAEYVGYELRGMKGMVVAVVALLAPCFLLMCGLSYLYFRFGSVPLVGRLFAGVQPVVVGILAWATLSMGRANIRHWFGLPIAAAAATALYFGVDVLLVTVGCGVLGIVFSGAWRWRKPEAQAQAADSAARSPKSKVKGLLFSVGPLLGAAAGMALPAVVARAAELALVFLKVGTVMFGGGFAAIPFLQREVVDIRHWLTLREFVDGVALGQMTPGPVAITATFIGYKVLGFPGALLATLGTFVPSLFMLWGLIHVYRRVRDHWLVRGFLAGVLPAIVGMILFTAVFIGRATVTGPAPALVAALALLLLLRFRLDPVWLILGGALLGLIPGGA